MVWDMNGVIGGNREGKSCFDIDNESLKQELEKLRRKMDSVEQRGCDVWVWNIVMDEYGISVCLYTYQMY